MNYEDKTSAGSSQTNGPVVVGLFNTADDAHRAVTQLRESGFSPNQIGAAFRHRSTGGFYGHGSAVGPEVVEENDRERESWWERLKDAFHPGDTREDPAEANDQSSSSSKPLSQDHDSFPPEHHEYDMSEIEGSLAGVGIAPDREAYMIRNLSPGGAIVTVVDAVRYQEAEQILSDNHGRVRQEDVAGNASAEADERRRSSPASLRDPDDRGLAKGDRVQLFGEVLRVHKERKLRGEVRLHKEVVTENRTVEVPVTHEELSLERVAVSGDKPAPSANIGEPSEIRVPLSGESVTVEKQPVLREEVIVGKHEITNVQNVADTVRREELRVDDDSAEKKAPVEDQRNDLRRPA